MSTFITSQPHSSLADDTLVKRMTSDPYNGATGCADPSIASPAQLFAEMPNRGSVDYVLRTVQQGLVHFSSMADAKANILITVCALLFSVGLTQFGREELTAAVLVLLAAAALSMVLAILAILPWVSRGAPRPPAGTPKPGNPLFFIHIAEFGVDDYVQRMDRLFSDPPSLTEAIVRDIHGQSRALALKKYRLLRVSYIVLLSGVVCSVLLLIGQQLFR